MSAEIVAIARFVPRPEARDQVRAALERVTVATRGLLAQEREIRWFRPLLVAGLEPGWRAALRPPGRR